MTLIRASKLDLSNQLILIANSKKSGFLNSPLNGHPTIEFLVKLLIVKAGLLCLEDLLEPTDTIIVKIRAELQFSAIERSPALRRFEWSMATWSSRNLFSGAHRSSNDSGMVGFVRCSFRLYAKKRSKGKHRPHKKK